jgi:ribosome biogenesis GTPase / thiamine phosphate phosphatase
MSAALATVVAVYGRQYLVVDDNGKECRVAALGRNSDIAVGDRVQLRDADSANVVLEKRLERRNVFQRSDTYKSKQLAANIDQVLCVISGEPMFSEQHLLRASLSAHMAQIPFVVVSNKADLNAAKPQVGPRMAAWKALNYTVIEVSAKFEAAQARALLLGTLSGKASLLIGQSGMGKSTLLNIIVPHAAQRTQEISLALNSGKQTTTFTQAFALSAEDGGGTLIDSPGFSEFGLSHVSDSQLQHAMPEVHSRMGQCRFYNCKHAKEPGCAVLTSLADGQIDQIRYDHYLRLLGQR